LARVGGAVLILFGLYMLGLRPRWGVALRYEGETGRPLGAFLLGATLALGWTPCIGPILGAILTLTAVGGGVGLLLAYILGLAVPFFLVALFADRLKGWLRRAGRLSHYVELFAGVVLILVGVLLLTDSYSALNTFFLRLTPEWLQKYL
jgi:cytochrome c-type biogenesis protein